MLITGERSHQVCPNTGALINREVREIMEENNGRLPIEFVESLRMWARVDVAIHRLNLVNYLALTRLSVGASG